MDFESQLHLATLTLSLVQAEFERFGVSGNLDVWGVRGVSELFGVHVQCLEVQCTHLESFLDQELAQTSKENLVTQTNKIRMLVAEISEWIEQLNRTTA